MDSEGSHYVCEKHEEKRFYSFSKMGWICAECEVEKSQEGI